MKEASYYTCRLEVLLFCDGERPSLALFNKNKRVNFSSEESELKPSAFFVFLILRKLTLPTSEDKRVKFYVNLVLLGINQVEVPRIVTE